ncbi:MAG TPA: pentapeptide repeat-containing protein [Hyphomicrobiaceae bacterium]|nr:pentapeptide repeat-containing protein [Hyphomicrobiaceae bacterium]
MPRSEHVSKLQEGARAWNAWRRENPRAEPQLGDLNLPVGHRQFGLAQGGPIDLSQADLSRAALEHATLIDADLTGAYLLQANLAHARLTGADLSGANLSDARLDHADLKEARLAEATLCGASLKGVRNLTQAQIDQAYGDEDTRLPAGLTPPTRWRKDTPVRSNQLARRRTSKPDGGKLNPYAVLGVPRGASLPEIRAAYLKLVKELHPDGRALDPTASELLKAVNKAYQDLRARARQPAPPPPQPRWYARPGAFFVVSFLGSSLILLAAVGGLYYAGLFGADDSQQRLAAENRQMGPSGRPHAAPAEPAAKPDPAQLAAARAAADDAAFLEAEREATSASFHRYLGRYSAGRHARQAAAALPAVVNTEIALGQTVEGQTLSTVETARSALRHYLDVYPDGRLAPEVERKLNRIAAANAARFAEREAWAEAERQGTPEGLRRYLAAHPHGENAAYATKALAALEASDARRAADQAAWSDASQEGSKAGLRRYLAAYPDGDHAAYARTAVAAIEASEARLKADRAAWAKASQDGSKPALTRYLSAHPDGDHAAAARQAIAAIEADQARQKADATAKAEQERSKQALNPERAADPEGAPRAMARQTVRAPEANEARHAGERVALAQDLAPETASDPAQASEVAPEQDPLSGPQKLVPPPAIGPRSAEEERLRDDANWLKAQRRNSKAAYAAYLLTHPNGRHAKEARASLAELQAPPAKLRPAASAKGFRQITQAFRAEPGASQGDAPASQKWQSADEPFIGADGRLRQR